MIALTGREHAKLLRDQRAWRSTMDGLLEISDELRAIGIEDRDIKAGIRKAIERIRSYEHSISWGVTCENCARLPDRLYENDMVSEVLDEREAVAEAVVDLMHPGGREVLATRRVAGSDRARDREEYVMHERGPNDQTMLTVEGPEGGLHHRAATIQEMVDLVLAAIARVAEGPAEK